MKYLLLFFAVSCAQVPKEKTLCLANLAEVGEPVLITEKPHMVKKSKCKFIGKVFVESCQGEMSDNYHNHLLRNAAGQKKGNRVYVPSWKSKKGFIHGRVYQCKK